MECPNCHAEIESGYLFCPECGQRLTTAPPVEAGGPSVPGESSSVVEISIGGDQEAISQPSSPLPPPPPPVSPLPSTSGGALPPSGSKPKKKRPWLWIGIGLAGVLTCVCLAIAGFWVLRTWNSGPTQGGSGGVQGSGSGSAPGSTAPVAIVNRSQYEICYVLISPSSSDDWGADWLGDDETILPGQSVTVRVPVGDTYDLQLLDCDQNVLDAQYQVAIGADGITYALEGGP